MAVYGFRYGVLFIDLEFEFCFFCLVSKRKKILLNVFVFCNFVFVSFLFLF